MKKILLLSVFSITILGAVLCTLNTNAQSRQSAITKHNNFDITKIGNTNACMLPSEIPCTRNTIQEKVRSGLDINSLIPIIDSIYGWEFDTLIGLWYLYPYRRMVDIGYDANNNLVSYVSENFNGAVWVKSNKYTDTYDINNNKITSLTQSWGGTAWVNDYQDVYTYDAFNNMTQDLSQNWNGTAWVNNYQYIYTYDASYNEIEALSQSWNGTAWINTSLYTYTYNTQNYIISEEDMTWTGSVWFNSSRSDYYYDVNNNVTSILYADWNGISYSKTGVITYTYDAGNYRTTELYQNWDGTTWILISQTTYLYDSHYNLTSLMIQKWGNSSWVNYLKESFTYDANDFTKTLAFKRWNPTAEYINGGDSLYYYFHTVMGISDVNTPIQNITVYPNPATDDLTIESPCLAGSQAQKSKIEILSINGQKIKEIITDEEKTVVDLRSFSGGVYIIRIITDKEIVTKKIIKE